MSNSKVENDFISWCNYIHPDINPYIFIQRHARYSEEYFPFLEELMTNLHHEISEKLPNINFSFKGRVKSKRSFLIKSFRTMAEGIERLFPNEYPTNPEEMEKFLNKREKNIEKYFKFLLKNNNNERFNEIKAIVENTPHNLGTLDGFRNLFNKLSPDEKENLVTRLGRSSDTFANRVVVNSVDFNVKSLKNANNGQIEIVDPEGNSIHISPSIAISSSQIKEEKGTKYVDFNGEKKEITESNLLYPRDLPANSRKFENALKTADGRIILLQDSIVIDDKEHFDIVSIKSDSLTGDVLLYNQYGESKNLGLLLNSSENIKLRKTDEKYTNPCLYQIRDAINDYSDKNDIIRIEKRFKDYVKNPKQHSNYKSLHDSFYALIGYSSETQIRDLNAHERTQTPKTVAELENSSACNHDQYKKDKMKKWDSNPIMHNILDKNPQAFDSSTEVLSELLYEPNVELTDLLGKYILVTKFSDGTSKAFIPEINYIFEHTFGSVHNSVHDSSDSLPHLDFSSYKNFILSRKKRYDAKSKGNYDIDLDID